MEYFTGKDSIVRQIWGKADTILFIFAGCSAEFALNKAVDWLYFTGKLPADPIKRLFSTVTYARQIVFAEKEAAHAAIEKINQIHNAVEKNRGMKIPAWAYRDVLFMLIHYSIASFELLERKLSGEEKEEVYDVFYRVGKCMQLENLPADYNAWLPQRDAHLMQDLERSNFSVDLFRQYKKHLGAVRFKVLCEVQSLIAPVRVLQLLRMKKSNLLPAAIDIYKLSRKLRADWFFKNLLLPADYKAKVRDLDVWNNAEK